MNKREAMLLMMINEASKRERERDRTITLFLKNHIPHCININIGIDDFATLQIIAFLKKIEKHFIENCCFSCKIIIIFWLSEYQVFYKKQVHKKKELD